MQQPFKTLVIRNPFVEDMDRFEELAVNCVESGVTHLTYTEVEPSLWEIDDPKDPYLHWSVVHTSMFKLFVPDLLKEWVPEEYARRQRELIAEKARILKKHGLKGAAFLYDPMYWPEAVYRAYPEYRGPRVDNPHSCLHPRYSPCVDHPEVLAMYQKSFEQLQTLSEGVLDLVILRTNDSGTGICWTRLYNGLNGPERCREISSGQRISRFLQACREGMDQGEARNPRIYIGGGAVGGERPVDLAQSLPEHCGYYSHARAALGGERILSGFLSLFATYPIRGLCSPFEIIEQLSFAHQRNWPEIVLFTCPSIFGNDWEGNREVLKVIELYQQNPGHRLTARINLAKEAAIALYGAEHADDIVEAWWNLYQAATILSKNTVGMANLIFWGSLAQRWLTRPLVVFPERLTAEEKQHYQPYLFQANEHHDSLDMLDQEPLRQFDGKNNLDLFNKHFDEATRHYRNACQRIQAVLDRSEEPNPMLAEQITAYKLLFRFLQNIRNVINFQIQYEILQKKIQRLDTVSYERAGELREHKILLDGLMRSEIDNSLMLAELVESEAGRKALYVASSEEGETPLMLGPGFSKALRKKAEVMLDHVVDIDEWIGYRT